MDGFKANDHQYGRGKVHWIDPTDPAKLWCGTKLAGVSGCLIKNLPEGRITCLSCRTKPEREAQYRANQERWEMEREERNRAWQREQRERQKEYGAYLLSPEWRDRRAGVLERDGFLCQGCRKRRATQVHHLNYDNIFCEMLFDLVAICDECHAQISRKP